jgi:hypothetical protein
MVRVIQEAKQIVVSEFSESAGPRVHTFRLTDDQWFNLTVWYSDAMWQIERWAQSKGYEEVKADIRWYANRGGTEGGIEESQIRFKTMTPSQWFLKHCNDKTMTGDEVSTRAAAFAEAWGASWGTIEEPEFIFGSASIVEIYAECGRGSLHSCMTDMCRTDFTQIYGTSKRCCIAVLRDDGDIVERALMFLPDTFPEGTPPGAGWCVSRIYPGDTPMSRSRMGPWFAANGVRSLRAVTEHQVVSGFRFQDEMYLPYLDIGTFVWSDDGKPGTAVTWHHNMPRHEKGNYNCYPGTWVNDYQGGPLAPSRCTCCNCGESIDEDEAVYPTDGDAWCRSCTDDEFSWCEVSSYYCSHEDMIEVHNCYMYDRVSRHVTGFRSRRAYNSDQIRYVRVELASGDEAFVPECETVDDRWVPDMEENGWVRTPHLVMGCRDAWRPSISSYDETEWVWEDPQDCTMTTVKISHNETMDMKVYGMLAGELNTQVLRLGLHWVSLQGNRLGISDDEGGLYRAVPRLRESARSYIVGETLNRDNIDLNNDDHLKGLDSSCIDGWDLVLIKDNTNTADTAETASNL